MTSQAEIGNLRVRLGIDSAEFANGVRSVQGSLSSLGSSLKAFATGAAAITLFNQAVNALHNVADMGDVAEAIGVTAEQLQVYNRMALASGASAEVMARGLQSIAEQSTDAKSKLSQLFDANGISMSVDMNQIILDFMNLLKAAKTPAEQLAIATGVLGDKVGRQLVESLRAGSSSWIEEQAKMKASGNYLAESVVDDAKRIETTYNQVMANISTAWQRMVVSIVQGFDSIGVGYVPGSGGARSAVANRPVPTYGLPVSQTYDGKGDLPGNINTGNGYGLNKPTENPFGLPSATKEKVAKAAKEYIPKDSLDDIYGYGEAFQTLWDDMEQGIPTMDAVTESLQNMADVMAQSVSDAIVGLISGTMTLKEAFRSMAQSLAQQLQQLAAQIIKSQIFRLIGMLAGGLTGGMGFSFGGMSFGGFYADGGQLGSGKWGIAGEAGPEIVHGPANITPMDKSASAPQMNVTVNNNVSSASVQTRQGADGRLQIDIIERELAARVARGGSPISAGMEKGFGLKRTGR